MTKFLSGLYLLVDNFDSFTYNLLDYIEQCGAQCKIVRNNTPLSEINQYVYDGIILSPGPGRPEHANHLMSIVQQYFSNLPILGICLGHQALGTFFGAKLNNAEKPMHGKITVTYLETDPIFEHIPSVIDVVRYHSLILDQLPDCLEVIAKSDKEEIMGIKHKTLPIRGIQFHPEAALTEYGFQIIQNWIYYTSKC